MAELYQIVGFVFSGIIMVWVSFSFISMHQKIVDGRESAFSLLVPIFIGAAALSVIQFIPDIGTTFENSIEPIEIVTSVDDKTTEETLKGMTSHRQSVLEIKHFVAAGIILLLIIIGCVFLAYSDDLKQKKKREVIKKSSIDQRLHQLEKAAKTLSKDCDHDDRLSMSFVDLSHSLSELIAILNKNKSYIDSRKYKKFINSHLSIYLEFIDEFKAVVGHLDDEKRMTINNGIQEMVAEINGVAKHIIDDRYLGISVKGEVIQRLD